MLKHLKKIFNAVEKEPEMVQETSQAPVLAVDNTAEMALVQAALSASQEQYAELSKKFEEVTMALNAVEGAKQALITSAEEIKAASRKAKVELALGTARAPALLTATQSLDDASFEAIVASLTTSASDEAKSSLFSEVGVSSKTDASAVVTEPEESQESKLLKAKYNKSK